MENLARLFEIVFLFFRRRFVIYGFEMSFWDIIIWVFVASLIICVIKEIFS